MKWLVRQGALLQEQVQEPDQWYVACYRIAFGPRAGRKVLMLCEAMPIDIDSYYERKSLCANEQGFSLHAAVRCLANARLKLEHLCR
jgi:hypothetical protein